MAPKKRKSASRKTVPIVPPQKVAETILDPLRVSLLVAGGAIVALSEWTLQTLSIDRRSDIVWPFSFGILVFLLPLISTIRSATNPTWPEKIIKRIAEWFHLLPWQIPLLLISPFLAYIAFSAAGDGSLMMNPIAAILAWVLAVSATILGSLKLPFKRIQWNPRALILPLMLTLIAFFLRAFAADRIPILLTGDEGSSGISATAFVRGEINNPFIVGWFSFPSLYFLIQSLSIRLFGQTIQALRVTSALAGALTVTATYFTARILFDRRTALVSGIFLAAYSYHINFSRIGLNNIWDGLWYTIVIGALWYGWEHEEIKAFVLAGLCLGIAQYFYPSGRILIIPIVLWFLIMAVVNGKKFKRVFPNIVILFLISLVVLLPLGIFYIHHPNEFMAPFNRVTLFGPILDSMVEASHQPVWLILLKQVVDGLGAFTFLPLNAWYTPGIPLLLPLPASLFLLGILILLVRNYRDRFPLLALWIITFGLIGGFSESTPAAQRYIAAAPVCALLVGFGLSELIGFLERLWPRLDRVLYGVTIAIAIFTAAYELYFYFVVYTSDTVNEWSHSAGMVAQRLADQLKGKPADLEVVFFGQPLMGYYSIPSLQYLVPNIQGVDATIPWDPQSTSDIQNRNHLFFVFLPGNESAIQPVEASYPGGKLYKQIASDGNTLYYYYEYRAP